uniref:Uncharacterized protein n=1 Tax=Arundo donax TaxID=35708 RepID=A0A0A9B5I9_ARUDO
MATKVNLNRIALNSHERLENHHNVSVISSFP